jgi:hypothetical protein
VAAPPRVLVRCALGLGDEELAVRVRELPLAHPAVDHVDQRGADAAQHAADPGPNERVAVVEVALEAGREGATTGVAAAVHKHRQQLEPPPPPPQRGKIKKKGEGGVGPPIAPPMNVPRKDRKEERVPESG